MSLLNQLAARNEGNDQPFLIGPDGSLSFRDVERSIGQAREIREIPAGAVVALVGDFDGPTIATMLELLDRRVILMPLASGTAADHEYFFDTGLAEWIIRRPAALTRRT